MDKHKMKLLLIGEAALVVILVAVAIFVGIGASRPAATEETTLPILQSATEPSESTAPTEETGDTTPTEPQPTDPEPTEPEFISTLPSLELESRNAFLYHVGESRLLYSNAPLSDQIYPASVTKLFTAHVALKYLAPDTVVTAGDEVKLVGEGSSIAFIGKGHRLKAEMLVQAMLLPSGNDAAYVIAVAAARAEKNNPNLPVEAAVKRFVELMNQEAAALGMIGSSFRNPDGYHDPDHYTCLNDLVLIGKLALGNDIIRTYAAMPQASVRYASGETITWRNTNSLIQPMSEYHCEDAIGLKTGSTAAAGNCLLAAFLDDGEYVIAGIFGCPEKALRFEEMLLVYKNYQKNH